MLMRLRRAIVPWIDISFIGLFGSAIVPNVFSHIVYRSMQAVH